ncbi:MAG: hypothetical protein ACRC0L_07835, partial [Angustibacter sp.]
QDDGGLEVVGSVWPARAGVLAAVVTVVGTVLGVVALVGGDSPDVTAAGPVVVLAGFAVAAVWPAARYLAGRRPVDSLTLDRHGFTARSRGRAEPFTWGDVTGFGVGLGGLTVQVVGHGGTSVPFPAAELRSDPALVARLLDHYRTHDRDRSDLASGAALTRLRNGELLH